MLERRGPAIETVAVGPHLARPIRWFLWAAGTLCVGLAALGAFLPLLPTTPFVLLAAGAYARSSPRFHHWLMSNRLFGPFLRDWYEHRAIPRRARVLSVGLVVVFLGSAILFVVDSTVARGVLAVIGVAVITFLLRLPVR